MQQKPESGSFYRVMTSWNNESHFFLDEGEALHYAGKEIDDLIHHPTDGPKIDGVKPDRNRLFINTVVGRTLESIDETHNIYRIWYSRVGVVVSNTPWYYDDEFLVVVEFFEDRFAKVHTATFTLERLQ